MDILKINTMAQPSQPWWAEIIIWVKDNIIVFSAFALGWKGIDRAFKYLSEGRDERIEALIERKLSGKVTPQIEKLSESIDELKEAIWELRK